MPNQLPPKKSIDYLRRAIIHSVCVYIGLVMLCFYGAHTLITLLTHPLIIRSSEPQALIATSMFAPIIVPIKLSLICGFYLSLPFIAYQLYQFIAPGLYQNERLFLKRALGLALILFYLGVLFAYSILTPMFLEQVLLWTPAHVHYLPDLSQCLDWMITLLSLSGLCFQVPLLTFSLLYCRIVRPETLNHYRGWVIVTLFTLAMLMTPPDVIMQILVGLPLWLLFESGVIMYQYHQKIQQKTPAQT
jgi:sec-independent protein translocase protein TatC